MLGGIAANNMAKTAHRASSGTVATISHCMGRNRSEWPDCEGNELSWGKVKDELYNALDATLMLAVIAGFAACVLG
jgi:hypothetical protein